MTTQRAPVSVEDLARIHMVGAPRLAPSGDRVAYTTTWMDLQANRYRSAVWTLDLDCEGEPLRLTSGRYRDREPRWSPCGSWIAFTSDREGSSGLWVIRARGGEAVRLTVLSNPVEAHCWSPDGRGLAFVSKAGPPPIGDNEPRVIRSIRYRTDGDGYLDERYRQIWTISFDPGTGSAGSPVQLTDGPFEHRQPVWSPDGSAIAFRASRQENWELGIASDIWLMRRDGSQLQRLTHVEGAWSAPLWAEDGASLLILGASDLNRAGYANIVLYRIPSTGGVPEPLTATFDRSIGDKTLGDVAQFGGDRVVWPREDGPIHFLASDRGRTHIFRRHKDPGSIELAVGGDRRIGSFCVLPDGGYVFAADSAADPGDLFRCGPAGEDVRRLTGVNDSWRRGVALSQPEEIWTEASDGAPIQGWLIRPPCVTEPKGVPVVLHLHGGPLAQYGHGFRHEFHLLAAQGYAVLFCNPRGSSGYGEAFAGKVVGQWGEADAPDVMAMIDAALERGGIDPGRIAVLGASYGGILTNWLIAHSDRFKAAVAVRSCADYVSLVGTDDVSYNTSRHTFGADVLEDPERYWRLSPLTHVENITTPLLLIHGERDYRCPVEQAEELYTALKRLGRIVELVRFGNEGHGLDSSGAPRHRLARLRKVCQWLGRWV